MKSLKFSLSVLAGLLSLGIACFIIGIFMAKAPEIHGDFIRDKVGSRTVMVKVGRAGGSGFHIKAASGKTYIMTNAHVCALRGKDNLVNVVSDTPMARLMPKRVIEVYKEHDLCLVEPIEGTDGLSLASSISVGETIGIVGHPRLFPLILSKGEYIGERKIFVNYGPPRVVSKKRKHDIVFLPIVPEDVFEDILRILGNFSGRQLFPASQLTAYSRGGSSGSPVVNFHGNVVAVLYAGSPSDNHESYSVPLRFIKDFLSVY